MSERRIVQEGECVSSIAFEHGFAPNTVWERAENTALRELRKNLHVLQPGDEVFIPDRVRKDVAAATGARHRFRRVGVPEVLRLQFRDAAGAPRAGVAYTIDIGEEHREGTTDAAGSISEWVPPNAKHASIVLQTTPRPLVFEVRVGKLDPPDVPSGIQARLENLGYDCAAEDGEIGPATRAAIAAFQKAQNLTASGEADAATIQRLDDVYRTTA